MMQSTWRSAQLLLFIPCTVGLSLFQPNNFMKHGEQQHPERQVGFTKGRWRGEGEGREEKEDTKTNHETRESSEGRKFFSSDEVGANINEAVR